MLNHSSTWSINKGDFFKYDTLQDKIRFLLRYAILAPSTHNSQPWLFSIDEKSVKLYLDPKKRLPYGDTRGRLQIISLGACLENLLLTASYYDFIARVEYNTNQSKTGYFAKIFFKPYNNQLNLKWQTLVDSIPRRLTARGTFKNLPLNISLAKLKQITTQNKGFFNYGNTRIDFIQKNSIRKQLARLTAQGIKLAYQDKNFRKEMAKWLNHNFSRRQEGQPGYTLKMPTPLSFVLPIIIKNFNLGRILAKLNYKSVSSAPLIGIISTAEDKPLNWLLAGRLAERLLLELTANGLRTSIFVAAIEVDNLDNEVKKILGINYYPQFLFCAGHMPGRYKHSPRIPVEQKILSNFYETASN